MNKIKLVQNIDFMGYGFFFIFFFINNNFNTIAINGFLTAKNV